jgi:hypothetical protein
MEKAGPNVFKWNLYQKQKSFFIYCTVNKGYRFSRSQPGCHLPNSPWPVTITFFTVCSSSNDRLFILLNLQQKQRIKQTSRTEARLFSAMPGALPLAGKCSRERHRGERRLPNARMKTWPGDP